MRNKAEVSAGAAPDCRGGDLRVRIRRDLERKGVAPRFSECVSERLEESVARLSPREYGAILDSVAAAYGEHNETRGGATVDDIADVQRLMQGFSEELQKLDEGLRMLSAYVSRLRERGARGAAERLH
jgi:hypothetical protein